MKSIKFYSDDQDAPISCEIPETFDDLMLYAQHTYTQRTRTSSYFIGMSCDCFAIAIKNKYGLTISHILFYRGKMEGIGDIQINCSDKKEITITAMFFVMIGLAGDGD